MSCNCITVDASPERVFEVLLDPEAYPRWVVGAKRIRAVDPDWPAVGSRFHHTVGGPAPADVSDSSKILALDPPRRLVLEVRFRPVGVGKVTIDVAPLDPPPGTSGQREQTRVTLAEVPVAGPFDRWWGRLVNTATSARNVVSLRRLRRLVEAPTA